MHVIECLDIVFSFLFGLLGNHSLTKSADPLEKNFNLCTHRGPYSTQVGSLHRVEKEE